MAFLKNLFSKEICVAVYVTKEDSDAFDEVLASSVCHYKVDKLRVGDVDENFKYDAIFAFKMKEHRYQAMINACAEAGIPLAVYSKVRYLHRIVK